LRCGSFEGPQRLKDVLEHRAMNVDPALDRIDPMSAVRRVTQGATQLDECCHHEDVHGDGAWAVQDTREHRDAVLGERSSVGAASAAPSAY
jgi:hypothetical protein